MADTWIVRDRATRRPRKKPEERNGPSQTGGRISATVLYPRFEEAVQRIFKMRDLTTHTYHDEFVLDA
eukprot:4815234-Lingulodinium_polyedra.AAC.1